MRRRGFCFVAFSGLVACGGGTPGALNPDRPLPAYEGHAAELFDNAIEPTAMGYPSDTAAAPSPWATPACASAPRWATPSCRARVTTVTSKIEDSGRSWQLGLRTTERLAGSGAPGNDFVLTIDPTDPAAGIAKGFEARLIGTSFVAFVRGVPAPRPSR